MDPVEIDLRFYNIYSVSLSLLFAVATAVKATSMYDVSRCADELLQS
jgi:hypothetical protein